MIYSNPFRSFWFVIPFAVAVQFFPCAVCGVAQEKPAKELTEKEIAEQAIENEKREERKAAISETDYVAKLQAEAIESKSAEWGHWGNRPKSYSAWTNHSNRLIPVYVFGGSFAPYMNENSIYRDQTKIEKLYGRLPPNTVRDDANHADQTDIYRLQRRAIEEQGKKYVFLIVFDGMDWQTTQAAAIYKSGHVYTEGKGSGLIFQDYSKCQTDYGYFVSSAHGDEVETDVDAQQNIKPVSKFGGYDARLGGSFPWSTETDIDYPIGRSKVSGHCVTDSSSSATSMTSGIKAINGALNLDCDLKPVEPIARWAQRAQGFSAGAVTSVPISHATPAAAYAANVSRDDYQDLTRDMVGLPSVARKKDPYPGLEVVLGGGYGEETQKGDGQGENFIPGNRYIADEDLAKIDVNNGREYGKYVVAQRSKGKLGNEVLREATNKAVSGKHRLFGFFGTKGGHLPFRTADGDFKPVPDVKEKMESYDPSDVSENPTLAEMTESAINVLETNPRGFWLMVEAGDVDWANHANNIDSSIGAVLSGEDAVKTVFDGIEKKGAWNQSLVIVTADHGHFFHLTKPEALAKKQ